VGSDRARRGNELVAGVTPVPRHHLDREEECHEETLGDPDRVRVAVPGLAGMEQLEAAPGIALEQRAANRVEQQLPGQGQRP
jgi:hypothetical protein